MLRLEWMTRLFSIFMAIVLSVVLNPQGAHLLLGIFFWINFLYALLLLFKKFVYPWPLGSYYNLTVEAAELMILLYIHSASASPLVAVLFLSFLIRMIFIYENKHSSPIIILAAILFILVDFYSAKGNSGIEPRYRFVYWSLGFGFSAWNLWGLRSFIESLMEGQNGLKDALGIKEILIAELTESREKLLETNDELYTWANTDPLTNLYNARYFNKYWDNILEQFQQLKQVNYPISLVMIDIQGHRIYNNVYGHIAGNILLQNIAKFLKDSAHVEDIVVRYSDYVFAVIIPGQEVGEAVQLYHRFKQKVIEYGKEHPGMRNIEISIGWSSGNDILLETKDELIARAISSMRLIN